MERVLTAAGGSPSETEGRALPRWLLLAVSFWGGFQIMVLEVGGFRVLQTNLGSSVMVTGTLLTIIMILLSVGYYLGGVLSVRLRSARSLFALLIIGALYTQIVTVAFLDSISAAGVALRSLLGEYRYLRAAIPATLLTFVLYGPPVLVMSMISPYWIRLQTANGSRVGADAGMQSGFFMSLSTVGSIVGTMLCSYVLIPWFGVAWSAIGTNTVFLVLATIGWLKAGPAVRKARMVQAVTTIVTIALGASALGWANSGPAPNVVYESESQYGQIQVVKEKDHAGRTMLNYYPSRVVRHSLLYPDEPLRDMREMMYLAPALPEPPKNILVLGSAAGAVLRRLEVVFPDARVTGVDIDPEVHEVAVDLFGIDPKRFNLVTADARMHLMADAERYDLIIIDLFAGEFVPVHCITREFFARVYERLTPRGAVFLNTAMNDIHFELPEADDPFRAVRHLVSTLKAAGFPTVLENTLFHSLFAYRDQRSVVPWRREMLSVFSNPNHLVPVRAAAGLAAFTTVGIGVDAERYPPFTDSWAPAMLIELKTNQREIYGELADAVGRGAAFDEVPGVVLHERLRERALRGSFSLRDVGTLIESLNRVSSPLRDDATDLAAKYFRYSEDEQLEVSGIHATTPWARLALLYAQMLRFAYRDEYEALMPTLESLASHTDALRG